MGTNPISLLGLGFGALDQSTDAAGTSALAAESGSNPVFADALVTISSQDEALAPLASPAPAASDSVFSGLLAPQAPAGLALPAGPLGETLAVRQPSSAVLAAGNAAAEAAPRSNPAYADALPALQSNGQLFSALAAAAPCRPAALCTACSPSLSTPPNARWTLHSHRSGRLDLHW